MTSRERRRVPTHFYQTPAPKVPGFACQLCGRDLQDGIHNQIRVLEAK